MEIGLALVFIVGSLIFLRRNKRFAFPITILYLLAIIYLAFLVREPMPIYHFSLKPLAAARRGFEFGGGIIPGLLSGDVKITSWASLEGILLNILLFVPFGYLVPTIWRKRWTWWKIILLSLGVSLCIEVIQLVTKLGFADIDDLMNNTIGAGIGFLLYRKCLTHVVNDQTLHSGGTENRK